MGGTADILLVKRPNGRLDSWYVPTLDGKHVLPDGHWWRWGLTCDVLAPDFVLNEIRCEEYPSYRWSLDGKALEEYSWMPDMEPVEGKLVRIDFILYHPESSPERP